MATCSHLDSVKITALPDDVDGCVDCLAAGGEWCHLRICLTLRQRRLLRQTRPAVTPRAHAASSGHQLMRSIQPGEDWSWCFADELTLRISEVTGEPTHPAVADGADGLLTMRDIA